MRQLDYSKRQVLFAQYPDEIVFLMQCFSDEDERLTYIKEISAYVLRVDLRWIIQLVSDSQYHMTSKSDLIRKGRFPESLAARIFESDTN